MSKLRRAILSAAAGTAAASGGSSGTYAEDVFSTFLYDGNGKGQTIENDLDLGAAAIRHIKSVDSGEVDITVDAEAGETVVVFVTNTDGSATNTCTVNGTSVSSTHELSDTHTYKRNLFISNTLTDGSNRIQVGTNNIGHTEVMIVDSNATVTFETAQNWVTSATQVTTSAVSTSGYAVILLSDRDPASNITSTTSGDLMYQFVQHSYFKFASIGMSGTGSSVASRTITDLTNNYAGAYFIIKIEGVGSSANVNSAASGTGGMTWIKKRSAADNHNLFDTLRGPTKRLFTHLDNSENTDVNGLTSFTGNGFTLNSTNEVNQSGYTFASWSFLKKPGFFDVVTYSGTGSAQNISHSLGSVPGTIIVKRYSATEDWIVYHRSTGNGKGIGLNTTAAAYTSADFWNSTTPTDSVFTVGTHDRVNTAGQTYVAYIFAHDDQRFGSGEDEAIIKCDSYTGNSAGDPNTDQKITVGFEPQFLIIRKTNNVGTWLLVDNKRGIHSDPVNSNQGVEHTLRANTNDVEETTDEHIELNADGFTCIGGNVNNNGDTYIYIAIRGYHKPASDLTATDLFHARSGTAAANEFFETGFDPDMLWSRPTPSSTSNHFIASRHTRNISNYQNLVWLNGTNAETLTNGRGYFGSKSRGYYYETNEDSLSFAFRRAPGFFDIVCHKSNGQPNQQINHNLGVVPEMVWIKNRSNAGYGWFWHHKDLTSGYNLFTESGAAETQSNTSAAVFTDTYYSPGNNGIYSGGSNSALYIAFLFATVAGISKVGSYTGTGSTLNVDCGFSNGARFVIIKRKDATADAFLFDTARGIVAGNDPFLYMSNTNAQTTNTDYIDPLSTGFTITSSAPAELNAAGGTFIFLAIA